MKWRVKYWRWINEQAGEWYRTGLMTKENAEKVAESFRQSYEQVEVYYDDELEKCDAVAGQNERLVMPIQPIKNGRFIANRIVEKLLEVAPIDLNDIACMNFTDQERTQFAQLIGYSLSGFSELSYVDDETFESAANMTAGMSEHEARNEALRDQLEEIRKGLKIAAAAAFRIHPDDLEA